MGDLIGLATARELEEQLAWVWMLMLLRGEWPVLNCIKLRIPQGWLYYKTLVSQVEASTRDATNISGVKNELGAVGVRNAKAAFPNHFPVTLQQRKKIASHSRTIKF